MTPENEQNPLASEEYKGLGPVTAAVAESTTWALGGHVIGAVAGGLAGWGLSKHQGVTDVLQQAWNASKEWLGRYSPKNALAKRFPLIAGGALFGTFAASYVGMVAGAVAGRKHGEIARDQFDRLQAGVQELQEENDWLKAKADSLLEQLKAAQHQPKTQVTEVAEHAKLHGHAHGAHKQHDSHVSALAAQTHGAAEVVR